MSGSHQESFCSRLSPPTPMAPSPAHINDQPSFNFAVGPSSWSIQKRPTSASRQQVTRASFASSQPVPQPREHIARARPPEHYSAFTPTSNTHGLSHPPPPPPRLPFLRKAKKPLHFQHRAVIQPHAAGEMAKGLVNVGADEAEVGCGPTPPQSNPSPQPSRRPSAPPQPARGPLPRLPPPSAPASAIRRRIARLTSAGL